MVTYLDWKKDKDNYRKLQELADRLCDDLARGTLASESEFARRAAAVRKLCEERFPDRIELFELVYMSRFRRLREQFNPSA